MGGFVEINGEIKVQIKQPAQWGVIVFVMSLSKLTLNDLIRIGK